MNEESKDMRISGKKFFITWSQCPAPKEHVYDQIREAFSDNMDRLIIGREKHEDGNYHLHGAIWFKKRIDRHRAQRIFDITYQGQNYHPQWEPLKSDNGARLYVCKEGDVAASFNWLEWKSKREGKGKKTKVFDEVINKKRPLHEAIKEVDLGMISGYIRLKEDLNEFLRDSEGKRDDLPTFLPNPWGRVLPSRRLSKKRHYWIYSRQPNRGKTTCFAIPLETTYRAVIENGDLTYWSIEEDTECIILDDYNGARLKYYELNQLCDGTYKFRMFMKGKKKLNKPLIIVLSNQSLRDLYPNMNNLLYERFNEIEIL